MDPKTIYQYKITLRGTSPPVWRRIQVPASYTLFQLHRAIVDAMGWYGEWLYLSVLMTQHSLRSPFRYPPARVHLPRPEQPERQR